MRTWIDGVEQFPGRPLLQSDEFDGFRFGAPDVAGGTMSGVQVNEMDAESVSLLALIVD